MVGCLLGYLSLSGNEEEGSSIDVFEIRISGKPRIVLEGVLGSRRFIQCIQVDFNFSPLLKRITKFETSRAIHGDC